METKQTYSDGNKIENSIMNFFSKKRTTEEQEDYVQKNPSWPIRYHISPERHNLLSWYSFKKGSSILEIGAGCGAVTGVFLKKDLDVTCVELTKRRADIIRERFKEEKNLVVLDGNIEKKNIKKKFDYVTLIGVLEYSGKYGEGKDPYLEMIKKAKSYLKSNGVLIVAIENRFGLKYWRGAPEDHTNILFDSLEGYPENHGVRTFGKKELTDLFLSSGFKEKNISFYYPLPDYKFCYEIFSDEYLPSEEHPVSSNIYPSYHPTENYHIFYESLVSKGLQKNDLFGNFANSFLVFINNGE